MHSQSFTVSKYTYYSIYLLHSAGLPGFFLGYQLLHSGSPVGYKKIFVFIRPGAKSKLVWLQPPSRPTLLVTFDVCSNLPQTLTFGFFAGYGTKFLLTLCDCNLPWAQQVCIILVTFDLSEGHKVSRKKWMHAIQFNVSYERLLFFEFGKIIFCCCFAFICLFFFFFFFFINLSWLAVDEDRN